MSKGVPFSVFSPDATDEIERAEASCETFYLVPCPMQRLLSIRSVIPFARKIYLFISKLLLKFKESVCCRALRKGGRQVECSWEAFPTQVSTLIRFMRYDLNPVSVRPRRPSATATAYVDRIPAAQHSALHRQEWDVTNSTIS